jgi:nucleoside-diphosphate-sugar epimerase
MSYVMDTVEGFILAANVPGIEGETINLGTGAARAIGDFARLILGLMGKTMPIVHDPARDRPARSEVMRLVSDNGRARRLLGWVPRVPVEDGLRLTIAFVDQNRRAYRPRTYVM